MAWAPRDSLKLPLSGSAGVPLRHSASIFPLSSISKLTFPLISNITISRPSVKIEARQPTRTESAKVRELRRRKKFTGTPERPRLSIFCSTKHLYAQLIDDKNKKTLAFASTLQESVRGSPPCNTIEAAERVGREIIKACIEQDIKEVTIDRNGFAKGERIKAFEIPLREHGFIPSVQVNLIFNNM